MGLLRVWCLISSPHGHTLEVMCSIGYHPSSYLHLLLVDTMGVFCPPANLHQHGSLQVCVSSRSLVASSITVSPLILEAATHSHVDVHIKHWCDAKRNY